MTITVTYYDGKECHTETHIASADLGVNPQMGCFVVATASGPIFFPIPRVVKMAVDTGGIVAANSMPQPPAGPRRIS